MTINARQEFLRLFPTVANYHHRYKVWSDFIHLSALSMYNALAKSDEIEAEYMSIQSQYKPEDLENICKLLSFVVMGLEEEVSDFLGSLYMELGLGNNVTGQFFTPYCLSKMMAELTLTDEIAPGRILTLHEPAAGSGGCVIAVAEVLKERGVNIHQKLFVSCVELDPTVAYMCYLQLSLLGISAEVIIGNSLSMEFGRTLKTPVYYLEGWDSRIKVDGFMSILDKVSKPNREIDVSEPKLLEMTPSKVFSDSMVDDDLSSVNLITRSAEDQLMLF